jgi:hypothetical protein
MTRYRRGVSGEEGFAVVYMAVILTGIAAVHRPGGRQREGYIVKAQLSKP